MSTDFPAWYDADLNSKAEVTTSSQTIAKPHVSCRTSMQELLSNILGSKILSEPMKIIVKAFIENQFENEKKQIENAFSEGFGCSCFSIDKSAEQYYNETYKL